MTPSGESNSAAGRLSGLPVQVDFETAVLLIAKAGVERVELQGAVDRIELGKNAGVLQHWHGTDMEGCEWERVYE